MCYWLKFNNLRLGLGNGLNPRKGPLTDLTQFLTTGRSLKMKGLKFILP